MAIKQYRRLVSHEDQWLQINRHQFQVLIQTNHEDQLLQIHTLFDSGGQLLASVVTTQGSTHAVDDHSAMGIGQLTESSIHTSTTMGGLIYRRFGVLQPPHSPALLRSVRGRIRPRPGSFASRLWKLERGSSFRASHVSYSPPSRADLALCAKYFDATAF